MNRKSALRVMVMEGMAMVPNLLRISSTSSNIFLSSCSPYASLCYKYIKLHGEKAQAFLVGFIILNRMNVI